MVVLRLLALGCLTVAFSACASVQVHSTARKFPSEATIENWLMSDDPRLVAWGAHDVLISRNEALTGDLLNLATEWQPLTQENAANGTATPLSAERLDKRDAMAGVLDALIQMNVPVPAETLRSLAPDFPNAVAVLLSRMTPEQAEPLALEFYHSPPQHGSGLQYVSAAMLAQHPPFGFAADLLASVGVRADIIVVLPGSGGGFGGGACSGACGIQSRVPRTGWPLVGQYSLSKAKSDRSMLLVSGIDPGYATRFESDSYRGPCGGPSLEPGERQRLIAEMLDISPDTIAWKIHPSPTIVFYSDEQFSRDLLRFIGDEDEKYRATAIGLGDLGLMTSDEVELSAPKLQIYINDMRGAEASPLPRVSPLPANVEWPNGSAWK
jgi:hypothetical protein